MRKGKRFTPSLLENWKLKGRGTGIGREYSAWHSITRGDPGSRGKSRIGNNNSLNRSMDLLSDTEFAVFCFVSMLPNLNDIREQYPLKQEEHPYEISDYDAKNLAFSTLGTLGIANALNVSHPLVRKHGHSIEWTFTTDLLINICNSNNQHQLLAVSIKDQSPELLSEREKDLLRVEREYWTSQGIEWLLITPNQYLKAVMINLKTYSPYAISDNEIDCKLINEASTYLEKIHNLPLTAVLRFIESNLEVSQTIAQKVFWQGVWRGSIPINLNRKPTSFTPIKVITPEQFWQQNPVFSRRTSCI